MDKSINSNSQFKKNLHSFLSKSEIEILEKINKKFIKKIIIQFSNFLKKNIKLNFYTINKDTYTNDDRNLEFLYCNSIKILPLEQESFIFFSSNLLSVFIDFLFGGNSTFVNNIDIKRNMTYTENRVNKKIIKLIIDAYCSSCRSFFSLDIEFVKCQIINLKKHTIYPNNFFITNFFNFSCNGIKIFLSILLPIEIIKQKSSKKINSTDKNIYSEKKFLKNNVSVKNIYDVKLDIVVELIVSPIFRDNFNKLSEGDILSLKNPKKIIAFIEKKPIFLGEHKIFNNQSIVFLEEFIIDNLKK
ncbi:FliM/FliN family flagellar motor switch protein [Buchnera aphidicola]|uniref:FliM/FliN family flagellar motor switch protein n=1 Tax=Buchnera aphidicola TaxID=9 RepID=UPI0034649F62